MMHDNEVRWQDEILEVMYWMRGERLERQVTRAGLLRFLSLEERQLNCALSRLLAARLLAVHATDHSSDEAFELTERGIAEGQRRFQEEFSAYLGRPSHLTCDDPACDCNAEDPHGVCPHAANGA